MFGVHQNGNPFDFRSPIRTRALLAGRTDELGEIDELLREAASGRPVHFSLFGSPGSGKSSLLNAVVDLARDRGLLAVKIALRDAIVETELDFYKALYDSALQALLDANYVAADDPVMRRWVLQTCTGDLSTALDADSSLLELGLVVAAKAQGRMGSAVPTPLLTRDLKRLLTLGGESLRGLVLCLDSAELLDHNRDLAPSLLQLADATPLLTIVTAAEASGSLQKAAPRAWAQIEVDAFYDPGDVLDAITTPLSFTRDMLSAAPPTPATAIDILQLTGGVPYEVNLVCHFIWNAIQQGEQEHFELSPAVIQRVTAELEEKGRHQASEEIAIFSGLSTADYELLVEIAPYESLTMRQLALVRLMLKNYEESDLQEAEQAMRLKLVQLEEKGVLRIERDRFEILGGRDARLYLKYAAKRHTGRKLRYGDSYPRAATTQCAAHLGRELTGDKYKEARIFSRGRPHEMGGSAVGMFLDSIGAAATSQNIVALSESLAVGLDPDKVLEREERSFILLGLQLQAGLHDVEHAELVANVSGASLNEARAAVARWITDHEELLSKYDVRIVTWQCEEIPADLLRAAVAYWQLFIICGASFIAYRAGAAEAAEGLVGVVLESAEKLAGPDPADPLLRVQFASALHRRGFMAATRGDWEVALDRLEQSRRMAPIEEWLLDYNASYVHAQQGHLDTAVTLATSALELYDEGSNLLVLHAYFTVPEDWVSPGERWNVVELQGNWIKRFLELQLLVLRAAVATEDTTDLESALMELSVSAPAPLLRLAGWAQLTLLNRPDLAAELFNQAIATTPYNEPQVSRAEAAYAEAAAAIGAQAAAGGNG